MFKSPLLYIPSPDVEVIANSFTVKLPLLSIVWPDELDIVPVPVKVNVPSFLIT